MEAVSHLVKLKGLTYFLKNQRQKNSSNSILELMSFCTEYNTDDEAERFYDPATFYSHGYPKSPMKTSDPMSYEEACILVERLFWRLVDELEPT